MSNIIYIGHDNPVIVDFTFDGELEAEGLNNFTDMEVRIGDEVYKRSTHPTKVITASPTELRVVIGDVTALEPGNYPLTIIAYNLIYDDGVVLSSALRGLSKVMVREI